MSEIKPKMVDGEAVCSRGCYRFNIDSDDDDDGVNSPEECGMVIGEGEPCFPYYRSQLAAERKRAEEARRLATLRGLGMLGLRDKLVSAESERDSLRATVERLESEAPAARTVTATVSAVLDEYGRDIVEVAKAVLELRATVEAVRELAKRNDCHCAWSKDGEPCTTCQFSSILEGGG